MKLIVTKYLNARTGKPDTNSTCPFYLEPGHILDIDDLVIGTPIDGNAIWYHSADDGCFYWSGGVDNTTELISRPNNLHFSKDEELGIYESAVNELASVYDHIPGFKGLAAGFKETQNVQTVLSLIFYVDGKIDPAQGEVPAVINYRGFPLITDVREIKNIRLFNIEPDEKLPYPMGGSISEIVNGQQSVYGSRSLLVSKLNKNYLLTCYHVACDSLFTEGILNAPRNSISVSIPSEKRNPGSKGKKFIVNEGSFGPSYDYAIIEVDAKQFANAMPDTKFAGFYTLAELKSQFVTGSILTMYGATSLSATGTLKTYHSSSVVVDETDVNNKIYMSGLIEASIPADGGDSGAPVVDTANNKLVGYVVAGNAGQTAYILPFAQLMFEFSLIPKL